jgi:hypothetical protein
MIDGDHVAGNELDWRVMQQEDILRRKNARLMRKIREIKDTEDKLVVLQAQAKDINDSINKTKERLEKLRNGE